MKELGPWPRDPRDAVDVVSRYLRYRANLRALGRGDELHVACILRGADQILPSSRQGGFEVASLASLVRDWASEPPFADLAFASFLIADNLNDLQPQVANNPRVARVRVPLPDAAVLQAALAQLRVDHPAAFDPQSSDAAAAESLGGVSIAALQSLVRTRAHERKVLGAADWVRTKKALVERDAGDLIEFIESKKTLEHYHGQDALKAWLRQDIALWQAGGPARAADGLPLLRPGRHRQDLPGRVPGRRGAVPVVKLKNFRDRWVGSSEGNLEKIFRLIRALGRCIVFIDEADQTLGKRDSGSGDSGLVRPPVLDDRAGDERLRQPRPHAVDPRLLAPGPDRGRSQAPRPRRREDSAAADHHAGGERRIAARAAQALRHRARRRRDGRHAAAAAADPGRRRGTGGQGVPALAHRTDDAASTHSRHASTATRPRCRATCSSSRCGSRSARPPTSRSCRRACATTPARPWRREASARTCAAAFNGAALRHADPAQLVLLAAFGLLGAFVSPGLLAARRGRRSGVPARPEPQPALPQRGRCRRAPRRSGGPALSRAAAAARAARSQAPGADRGPRARDHGHAGPVAADGDPRRQPRADGVAAPAPAGRAPGHRPRDRDRAARGGGPRPTRSARSSAGWRARSSAPSCAAASSSSTT